jgi:hypothetical protein
VRRFKIHGKRKKDPLLASVDRPPFLRKTSDNDVRQLTRAHTFFGQDEHNIVAWATDASVRVEIELASGPRRATPPTAIMKNIHAQSPPPTPSTSPPPMTDSASSSSHLALPAGVRRMRLDVPHSTYGST